ncbi:MAG: hypothetical protein K2I81_00525 [Alphaproteobacteria bacterium]|nr:hypothetical protein [Alphaproteobacteria bacterium]
MARVLQIRRGTSAQNDNFTGLPGELSFDTDAKTLRVHDGECLGGYPLARGDRTGAAAGTEFDINSVPDDFWAATVAKFAPAPFTVITSRAVPIRNTTTIEYIFNIEQTPFMVNTTLVCAVADAGYSVGEEVSAFGVGPYTAPAPNLFRDISGLHVRMPIGRQNPWVCHRDTGVVTTAAEGCWNLLFRLYC